MEPSVVVLDRRSKNSERRPSASLHSDSATFDQLRQFGRGWHDVWNARTKENFDIYVSTR
jgi:hypothetical protein